MNNTLLASVREADGRYLSDLELRPFDQMMEAFQTRMSLYSYVRDNGKTLVLNALRRLMQTPHRQVVQEHAQQCQRDMLFTLEYVSKGILLNDEASFMEEYLVWMQNIMRSFNRQSACVAAYRLLKEEVRANLPGDQSNLMMLYLDKLVEALNTGI
ncbi:hypothetical protein IQ273_05810 [Nodosilinea sp. LEGE 07298]|uniref:hypothetical protein n=1 Tax=Nodosilinea sp. LEGE 07298 TaxID=2777970 RepID=UPI00187DEE15|nr:hypothetical protein [Nodosilinea sp. LEGE 07298]MBE9108932.1 hypothetical protein [Nodosilinea sp. LEGE 07298]